eukprot:SM000025S08363  [mRNA]  locus=s25:327550:329890:+ [translate_table: standard]
MRPESPLPLAPRPAAPPPPPSPAAANARRAAAVAGGVAVSRVCDLTGKKRNNGYKVSFSKKRTKHLQQPNLQYRRLWWPEGNRFVRLRLCTKALKTVERKGLAAMAAEAGLDLNKH